MLSNADEIDFDVAAKSFVQNASLNVDRPTCYHIRVKLKLGVRVRGRV